MKQKFIFIFITIMFLVSCTSNMVLYRDDIKGFDLAEDTLVNSPYCDVIQKEYKAGKKVIVAKGTRWVDPASADGKHYACRIGDVGCKNEIVSLTEIKQDSKYALEGCMRASIGYKSQSVAKAQKKIVSRAGTDNTKRSKAFNTLIDVLLNKKIITSRKQKFLYYNFSNFTAALIKEADVTDIQGNILLGTSQPIVESYGIIPHVYRVQQVFFEMVILDCGKCGLPPVGIRRVDGRPSPIEGQVFNDTRAIYKFVGIEHYRTLLNDRRQVVLFDRVSMRSLNLPSNYLHQVMPSDYL